MRIFRRTGRIPGFETAFFGITVFDPKIGCDSESFLGIDSGCFLIRNLL